MGNVKQFVSGRDRERDRLIREARAIYESIFPAQKVGLPDPMPSEKGAPASPGRPAPPGDFDEIAGRQRAAGRPHPDD
ncbi:hypothetical protein XI00_26065 [Bradyrhizobium sp. CCBAU 21359]|nr:MULTISPECIES: hypothetical protein [unclassified Bradyrhizobium]MDA9451265.1 hypothetical protein [Bradyrhizobium sp. CCBAU 21360]MDA9457644.1 hypothetical protein [Bradyrhizobium sp. CCBAU 21359]